MTEIERRPPVCESETTGEKELAPVLGFGVVVVILRAVELVVGEKHDRGGLAESAVLDVFVVVVGSDRGTARLNAQKPTVVPVAEPGRQGRADCDLEFIHILECIFAQFGLSAVDIGSKQRGPVVRLLPLGSSDLIPWGNRRDDKIIVVRSVKHSGLSPLLQVAHAVRVTCPFARLVQRGQQHSRQNRNDCNHDKKFNQRK